MRASVINAMHSSTVVSGVTTIKGGDMISRTAVSRSSPPLERQAAEVVPLREEAGDRRRRP